jgi:hypothetical protein
MAGLTLRSLRAVPDAAGQGPAGKKKSESQKPTSTAGSPCPPRAAARQAALLLFLSLLWASIAICPFAKGYFAWFAVWVGYRAPITFASIFVAVG